MEGLRTVQFVLLAGVLLFEAAAMGQLSYERPIAWNLPEMPRERMEKAQFFSEYDLSEAVNPFYLRADFDGDRKADYAVLVVQKNTSTVLIAICRSRSTNIEILTETGDAFLFGERKQSRPMRNGFGWMDAWHVFEKQTLAANELNEKHPPPMNGEGIEAIKTEAASVLFYWTRAGYYRYQLGD